MRSLPGRTRTRASYRDSSDVSDEPVPIHGVAKRLLVSNEYKISLTEAQIERFTEVFDLILEPGETEIPMDLFSEFVRMEARLLGSGKLLDYSEGWLPPPYSIGLCSYFLLPLLN